MGLTKTIARSTALLGATVATLVCGLSSSAQAYQLYLGQDSKVDFTFLESHGAYKSALKLYGGSQGPLTLFAETKAYDTKKDDYAGYCGSAVVNCFVSHLLAKGTYYLGLDSGSKGISYDAKVIGGKDSIYSKDGLKLGFEDSIDADYNDFVIHAQASPIVSTPEPSFLIGAGVVGATLLASKKRATEA